MLTSELEITDEIMSHERMLMGFALKLTKDYDDASDLLQDTLVRAFKNQHRFQLGTNLSAWLHTIMKNSFLNNYKRIVRQNTFIDKTEDAHFINLPVSGNTFHTTANLHFKELEKEIDRLDDIYSIPFMMYFNGFKYQEIADRMSLPLGTVKNRIHTARKLLKGYVTR